jgi:chaperone BCS1
MGEATESQRMELYCRFFPRATNAEAREFAQAHYAETMAEFQGQLLALENGGEVMEAVASGSELAEVGR